LRGFAQWSAVLPLAPRRRFFFQGAEGPHQFALCPLHDLRRAMAAAWEATASAGGDSLEEVQSAAVPQLIHQLGENALPYLYKIGLLMLPEARSLAAAGAFDQVAQLVGKHMKRLGASMQSQGVVQADCEDEDEDESSLADDVEGLGSRTQTKASGQVNDQAELPPCPEIERLNFSRFEQEFDRLSLLGRGAFGEVWRCRRKSDGHQFAIKVVRYRGGGTIGRNVERQVLREAQLLSRLQHPNIVKHCSSWLEMDWPYGDGRQVSSGSETGTPFIRSTTPFAPPPSPSQLPNKLPSSSPLDGMSLSGSSYHGDASCISGVVFELEQEEQAIPSVDTEDDLHAFACCTAETSPGTAASATTTPAVSPNTSPGVKPQRSGSFPPEDCELEPEYKSTLYIQAELCEEMTLQGWIAARNALITANRMGTDSSGGSGCNRGDSDTTLFTTAPFAISLFLQVTMALAHLHERSCVHRDVKPSNILFVQDDTARLGDFGLAKVLEEADGFAAPSPPQQPSRSHGAPIVAAELAAISGAEKTPGGTTKQRCATVGTPSYASPEQLIGGTVSGASDVYSLGMVLAELISPVQTQMERAAVMEGLRKQRQLPAAAHRNFPTLAKLAVGMTHPETARRPSAAGILEMSAQVHREAKRLFNSVDHQNALEAMAQHFNEPAICECGKAEQLDTLAVC